MSTNKILTQAALARKWGISRQAVCKLAAKGMPMHSESAAMNWRRFNANGQRLRGRGEPASARAKRDLVAETLDEWANHEMTPEEMLAAHLGENREIRTLIDSMPAACAARCNPSDPLLATQVLRDWVNNQFLKRLEWHEVAAAAGK